MKRHFMLTMWPQNRHPTREEMNKVIDYFDKLPKRKYCVGQYEQTKDGQVHLQIYLEMHQSVRLKTMINKLRAKAWGTIEGPTKNGLWKQGFEVQFRKYSRDACRKYCSNPLKRLESELMFEVGQWQPSKTGRKPSLNEELEWLLNNIDVTVEEIAFKKPALYLRYGDKIDKLLHLRKIYSLEIREEE